MNDWVSSQYMWEKGEEGAWLWVDNDYLWSGESEKIAVIPFMWYVQMSGKQVA